MSQEFILLGHFLLLIFQHCGVGVTGMCSQWNKSRLGADLPGRLKHLLPRSSLFQPVLCNIPTGPEQFECP